MTVYYGEESAAALSIGTDILADNNEQWRSSNLKRILTGVWIVGSTAVGDFVADIVIGEKIVATLSNTQAGAAVMGNRDDYVPIGHYVGSGSPVQLIVRDPSNTNPVRYQFYFKPWKTRRRRFRRAFRRAFRRRVY